MNILSCFDGISAGLTALKRAGIPVTNYYVSEIDKYAIKVATHNHPEIVQLGDVTNYQEWDLPEIDMIIGGAPCQSWSVAGKQQGLNDTRGNLLLTFVDVIKHYKPKYFLLENVKMSKEHLAIFNELMGVTPILIDSALVSGQRRQRYYWTNIPNVTQPENKGIMFKDIVEVDVDAKYTLHEGAKVKIQKYIRNYTACGKSPTLTTELSHSTGFNVTPKLVVELGVDRRITPVECERLQTFPDNYTNVISDSQRYKCLANSWTVDVITHIFGGLKCATTTTSSGFQTAKLST